MKTELVSSLTANFEGHAQRTENGVEFWLARDLQHLLGYGKWDNFQSVISKAKTACELSGHVIADHFADVGKMVRRRITGNQFTARVKRPAPQWRPSTEQVTGQVEGQVTGQVSALLFAVAEGEWSRKNLMEKLQLKGRDNFEKLYLRPALEGKWIAMTIPDKPNSRLQKYRLTKAGRQVLQQIKNKAQP